MRLAKNGCQWQLFVHPLETCEKDPNKTEKFWLHWHSNVLINFRSPWIYVPFTCGTLIDKVEHTYNTDYMRLAKNGCQRQLFIHPLETCEKNPNKAHKFWLNLHSKVLSDIKSPWIFTSLVMKHFSNHFVLLEKQIEMKKMLFIRRHWKR